MLRSVMRCIAQAALADAAPGKVERGREIGTAVVEEPRALQLATQGTATREFGITPARSGQTQRAQQPIGVPPSLLANIRPQERCAAVYSFASESLALAVS